MKIRAPLFAAACGMALGLAAASAGAAPGQRVVHRLDGKSASAVRAPATIEHAAAPNGFRFSEGSNVGGDDLFHETDGLSMGERAGFGASQ